GRRGVRVRGAGRERGGEPAARPPALHPLAQPGTVHATRLDLGVRPRPGRTDLRDLLRAGRRRPGRALSPAGPGARATPIVTSAVLVPVRFVTDRETLGGQWP